jgi:hypothetical protein
MNTTPITKKKPTLVSAKSGANSPLARETSALRAHAEAFQQAVSDLEKAFSGGKGPHPPLPGPGGHLLAAMYSSLGDLLQSAGTLNKQIAGSLKTELS